MKKKRYLILMLAAVLFLLPSCITPKKINYLQDMVADVGIPLNEKFEAVIVPYDELTIRVYNNGTDDSELIAPFNVMSGRAENNNTNQSLGYLVDVNGNIVFPILGELHVEGMTRLQLQDHIKKLLVDGGHLNDPLVSVRFRNFKIFFLSHSGGKVLNITNERCTFLEALAQGSALGMYTRRDKVGVMREVNGNMVIHYMDPRSSDIFNDEFFLLQQNDIIITRPFGRVYFREALSNWGWIVSLVTSISSLALLVLNWIERTKKD